MKTTITDISKDTGLSIATISKYLNHKPVLPENAEKIKESIKKLHYEPNQIAQSLRSKKTKTVALILPSLKDSLWGRIVNPISTSLIDSGYTPIICTNDPIEASGFSLSSFLLHNQIAGAIAIGNAFTESELLSFSKNQLPIVCVDYDSTALGIDCVVSANFLSAYEAGVYLIKRNHRRIGVIGGSQDSYTMRERSNGFLKALNEYQIPSYPEYCMYEASTVSEVQYLFRKLLSFPEPPTAVFLLNYTAFMGSFMEIMNNQIRIPEDISLLCFERDAIFDTLSSKITSIEQNYTALGMEAVKLFLKRISAATPAKRVLVPTTFLEGDSVAFVDLQSKTPQQATGPQTCCAAELRGI